MFGRKRRIQEATTAVRDGYDRALVDAGVVLFQQVVPEVDGHYVSSSMLDMLGWDPTAFRDGGTLRRLVHPDDLPAFRALVPIADGSHLPAVEETAANPTTVGPTSIDLTLIGAAVDAPDSATVPPGTNDEALTGPLAPPPDDSCEPVIRFLAASGAYRPMLVRVVTSAPGEPRRGALIDASANEARDQRARRLAEVAEQSHHGHLMFELTDRDDPASIVFRSANLHARRLFDLDRTIAVGGRLEDVFDGPSARLLQSALFDVAHTGESLTAERLAFAELPDTHIDMRIDRLRDGSLGVTIDDVSRFVEVEERLRHQASHDHLTGLPNRSALDERLALVAAGLPEGQHVAVVLVDVDGLDVINRGSGHHVGDQLLVEIGRRLGSDVSGIDLVARVGGDEFALISAPFADRAAALDRARAVDDLLEQPFDVEGDLRHIRCTIGASVAPEHGLDPATLLRAADSALRQARSTADVIAVFDPVEERSNMRRVGLLTELRQGLANSELELRYQPMVDLRTGRVTKVEALLRWQRIGNGAQRSVELLEMAERSGLIEPLTRWLLGESARAGERLRRDHGPLVISTNLSMHNLRRDELLTFLDLLVSSGEVSTESLELELSEKELTDDPLRSKDVIAHLRGLGIGVVIDVFGTGFMSVDTRPSLGVDGLKIDRGYTTAISSVPADADAVEWAIDIAHSAGALVTADGVADGESLSLLAAMGCDHAQGLYLSEPVSFESLPGRVAELEDAMLGWVGSTGVLVD